jgi:hypothetical protein
MAAVAQTGPTAAERNEREIRPLNALMAVVVGKERDTPCAGDVLGVITRDYVADSAAASIEIYPGEHWPAHQRQKGGDHLRSEYRCQSRLSECRGV